MPGSLQAEGLPGGVSILDPAAQLRQPRLDIEAGQAVPVEAMRGDRRARVHLDLQSLLARVRLPGDASRRVARMKGAQAREIFVAATSSPARRRCPSRPVAAAAPRALGRG